MGGGTGDSIRGIRGIDSLVIGSKGIGFCVEGDEEPVLGNNMGVVGFPFLVRSALPPEHPNSKSEIRTCLYRMLIHARKEDWFAKANAYAVGNGEKITENLSIYPVQLYKIAESAH